MLTDSTYPKKDSEQTVQIVAVIDIGATSLRMQIAQINPDGTVEKLESLSQAVSIGRDSFIKGFIERKTIDDCVQVLKAYREKLFEYGVHDDRNVRVIATSGVRDARNRLAFQDRVYVATGFDIEPFEQAELHRATYLGILPYFARQPEFFSGKTAICEVGGGSTELLLLQNQDVAFANTLRLGSLRLRKMLEAYDAPIETSRSLLESQIAKSINAFKSRAPGKVENFISMGSEIRYVAAETTHAPLGQDLVEVKFDALEKFLANVLSMSPNKIAHQFHIALPDAQTFGPALLTHYQLAKSLGVEKIMVANVNLRDSLVKEMAPGQKWASAIQDQIVRSAMILGRKFNFDEKHAVQVTHLALKLFDELQDQHQLDIGMRLILRLAGLLHEIGRYIHASGFHKHSMYLIRNSELFGIGERDQRLISLVARYHRRALPQPSHEGYSRLSRQNRVAVSKMASILRIANAMDETHSQNIEDFELIQEDDRVIISVQGSEDISLEQLAVNQNKQFFEDIYGTRVQIQKLAK